MSWSDRLRFSPLHHHHHLLLLPPPALSVYAECQGEQQCMSLGLRGPKENTHSHTNTHITLPARCGSIHHPQNRQMGSLPKPSQSQENFQELGRVLGERQRVEKKKKRLQVLCHVRGSSGFLAAIGGRRHRWPLRELVYFVFQLNTQHTPPQVTAKEDLRKSCARI